MVPAHATEGPGPLVRVPAPVPHGPAPLSTVGQDLLATAGGAASRVFRPVR